MDEAHRPCFLAHLQLPLLVQWLRLGAVGRQCKGVAALLWSNPQVQSLVAAGLL
jgi:hypothetical protein